MFNQVSIKHAKVCVATINIKYLTKVTQETYTR